MHFLPRKVLRWIQELNLTYSVKNPTRDLANGFTFAEIIGRYFPNDISMHSFDPGISLVARKDNWSQLLKVLSKQSISCITSDAIEDIIHYKEGAVVKALVELFAALTSRERPDILRNQPDAIPRYAQPTASYRVKDPSIERTVDEEERRMKAIDTIHEHEGQVRRDRPSSMSSRRRNRSGKRAGELHPISNEEKGASVEVKHIEIKAFGNATSHVFDSNKDAPCHTSPTVLLILTQILKEMKLWKDRSDPLWFLLEENLFDSRSSEFFFENLVSRTPEILNVLSTHPSDLYLLSRVLKLLNKNECRLKGLFEEIHEHICKQFPETAETLWKDLVDTNSCIYSSHLL